MGKQDERKKLNKNGALNKAHKRKKTAKCWFVFFNIKIHK